MSLTPEGYIRPRLNEIKADYDQRFQDAIGPVNTNPDSVIGEAIAIFSAALDDAYEDLQNTYDSMYPPTAEDTALDGAVSFVGMERIGASPTTAPAMVYGTENTFVPAGLLARALDKKQYASAADVIIQRANAGDVRIKVGTVSDASAYQIIAAGASVTFNSDGSATEAEIIAGLAALFDPDIILATAIEGNTVLRLRPADQVTGYPLTIDSKLYIDKLSSPIFFVGLENGAYSLPATQLNQLDTIISGVDSVLNLVDGDIGRFVETNEELRERHANSGQVTGSATQKAIQSRLQNEVAGVTFCRVYENRTNTDDAMGLPGHAIEVVVAGGATKAVAEKVFEVKGAGIETYGNTTVNVIDPNGDEQPSSFSRPQAKYAWLRVTVIAYDEEETPSVLLAQAIKDAVMSYAGKLGIGEDIINQRFYGPIFEGTTGLATILVETALTDLPGDVPSYGTTNLSIDRAFYSVFDTLRIVVIL